MSDSKSQEEIASELTSMMERFLAQTSEIIAYKDELDRQAEQIKKMQEEIHQSRVLSALGEMAATVAHEIRNPLGGIAGYASLLARSIPPEDTRRKYVDKIIGGISSLNKIVSNLLVYTRKTNLQKQSTDLVAWAEAILSHAEIEIEKEKKNVRIERDFPSEPLNAEIDSEKLQQVMLNLLINGIQAIEIEGKIFVSIKLNGKAAEITVADTGKGIEPEHLKNIFTPFFTTKEQGTGLGLAIVKKIVDLHEGEISVQSEPNEGTKFCIKINV
jgi:signal transduction histidine kinase